MINDSNMGGISVGPHVPLDIQFLWIRGLKNKSYKAVLFFNRKMDPLDK